jgi:hypothetical protein
LPAPWPQHWQALSSGLARALWSAPGLGQPATVFYDPRCPACQSFYARGQDPWSGPRAHARWVPVALLGTASLEMATELQWRTARLGAARGSARAMVLAHTSLLRLLCGGVPLTPSLAWCTGPGRAWFHPGPPPA